MDQPDSLLVETQPSERWGTFHTIKVGAEQSIAKAKCSFTISPEAYSTLRELLPGRGNFDTHDLGSSNLMMRDVCDTQRGLMQK